MYECSLTAYMWCSACANVCVVVCVPVCCSEVSLMPSTALGSRKIVIKGGSDVTNQTCLYPGVQVMPGACLGVFTYAEAERTFPRDSIVQVSPQIAPAAASTCTLLLERLACCAGSTL